MVPWLRIAAFAAFALPITLFDIRHLRIPDAFSLGGILVVLLLDLIVYRTSLPLLLLEISMGFGVFWAIRAATGGKLGLGDAKFSALIAVSLGMHGWLTTIAVASVTGLFAGIAMVAISGVPRGAKIPFAPFLTFGTAVSVAMQYFYPGLVVA